MKFCMRRLASGFVTRIRLRATAALKQAPKAQLLKLALTCAIWIVITGIAWEHYLVPWAFESARLYEPRPCRIFCQPRATCNCGLPDYLCGNRGRNSDPTWSLRVLGLAALNSTASGCVLGTCRQRLGVQLGRQRLGISIAAGDSCKCCSASGKWSVRTAQIAIDRRIYPAVFAGLIRTSCGDQKAKIMANFSCSPLLKTLWTGSSALTSGMSRH